MAPAARKPAKSRVVGPTHPTPFSERFYAAWQADGRTLDALSRATGIALPTISAYLNGERGSGGQKRSVQIIEALADALGVPLAEAMELSGMSTDDGVVTAIERDAELSKSQKAVLRGMLREMRGRTGG